MVITDSTNNKKNHGTINSPTKFFTPENETHRLRIRLDDDLNQIEENEKTLQLPLISTEKDNNEPNDSFNYALLIALYTLQGIPMGLSASIPFLIQQKVKLSMSAVSYASTSSLPIAASIASSAASASRLSYNANAIFALCSWPFSLKLLWAPIVDACFIAKYGRRKSWLVPVQFTAALLMVCGANFVERQLGLGIGHTLGEGMNIKGVTVYFFALYFLMATQDIAVDGWALTMLSKQNRGHGPVCNSIGQNIGYFLSFVGFLALNDAESSEALWRPLLGMKSKPDQGLVSLGTFIRFMGYFMLIVTTGVAILKKEVEPVSRITKYDDSSFIDGGTQQLNSTNQELNVISNEELLEMELDSAKLGLRETYQRLWAVCKLPAVKSLFIILLTYRLPTALGDNVKFLKAVEFGLSKSTTAVRTSIFLVYNFFFNTLLMY